MDDAVPFLGGALHTGCEKPRAEIREQLILDLPVGPDLLVLRSIARHQTFCPEEGFVKVRWLGAHHTGQPRSLHRFALGLQHVISAHSVSKIRRCATSTFAPSMCSKLLHIHSS
jgi:hypothetical protein